MTWNWEQDDWPVFRWDKAALEEFETVFLRKSGVQIGSIRHFDEETRLSIMVDMMANEAIKTSEIEGEILDRGSVQSSIMHHFGLVSDQRRVPPAERGIADMMVDLHRHSSESLSHDYLHNWHKMVMNGRYDLQNMGSYRTDQTPMQVVSGPIQKPVVHFEAPPSKAMQVEMTAFIAWYSETAPGGAHPLPPLTRAGLVHLYFVAIHPYEDGNGRIARALADKALAQATGAPTLLALSYTIQRKRNAYYQALEENNKALEVTAWLAYFAQTILEAQDYTQRLIDFLIAKAKLYDRVRDQLNSRQEKVLERMFREGLEGFAGGLSAANYITISGASRATATRDLQDLVRKAVFIQRGTLKSTRYRLNITGVGKGGD